MLFRPGRRVILVGDVATMLAGNFEVRVVEPGAVTLTALGSNRTVVMKPRHTALRDHQGNSLDVWTICNVFVDGTHLTNGIVCEGSDDSVFVQLGS